MTSVVIPLEEAMQLAGEHYENFPVAPFFFEKRLREGIKLIYAFARIADDIADEGDDSPSQRLDKLDWMDGQLSDKNPSSLSPFFAKLNTLAQEQELPLSLFHDLLSAFKQDVVQQHYQTEADVLDYCRRSANPVGRLLLHLTQQATAQNCQHSDAICTALQLINFIQDWHSDLVQRQRLYIPLSDLPSTLEPDALQHSLDMQPVLATQCQRARQLMTYGAQLTQQLTGRFGLSIRLTVLGGARILKKCEQRTVLTSRPTLKAFDWAPMLYTALFHKDRLL